MPLSGRICLVLFAMAMTLSLVLDHPRPLAVRPPTHLAAEPAPLPDASVP